MNNLFMFLQKGKRIMVNIEKIIAVIEREDGRADIFMDDDTPADPYTTDEKYDDILGDIR